MTLLDPTRIDDRANGPRPDVADSIVGTVTPAPRSAWWALADADPASMADHTPLWTDAITASGPYRDASRLYELSDGRRFVLPLVQRTGLGRLAGLSGSFPDGWGFGGLVGPDKDASAVRLVLDDLASLQDVQTRIRPDPLEGAMWAAGAPADVVTTPRRAHVLDLRPGVDALRAAMHPSARRALRRAEKAGVQVVATTGDDRLEEYYGLYERSLARWAAASHEPVWLASWRGRRRDPLDKLRAMAEHLGDRFRLYLAYVEGRPAAGQIVLFGNAAHDTRGAMDKDLAGPVRANQLLQWRAIVDATEAGCTTLHLGESGTSTSLARYKEHYGARSVPYHDYRVERLPVTAVDRALRAQVKRAIGFREG